MRRVSVKYFVICLLILELITVFLIYKSFSNKDIDEKKESYQVDKKLFAMYTENEDGTYEEYNSSNYFPGDGYLLNLEKSNCVDNKGNKIDGILSRDNNKITVNSNKNTFCYFYFKKSTSLYELCKDYADLNNCITNEKGKLKRIDNLSEEEQGGMYRYQGTQELVNNNYICFGTSDTEECTSDTDKYMYRIIGITSDGKLKLIKKEALNEAISWGDSYGSTATWPESLIYQTINGNKFLENSEYMPVGWRDKIAYTSWKYNDMTIADATTDELYNHVMSWSDEVLAKIGVMYDHDYYYSQQSGGKNCWYGYGSEVYSACTNGWIHLSQNDTLAPHSTERLILRTPAGSDGYHGAMQIEADGGLYYRNVYFAYSIRPVFYLDSDEIISSGDGTINNPYIIKKISASDTILEGTDNLSYELQAGLYRYQGSAEVVNNNYICFGTRDVEECTSNTDQYLYRIIGISQENDLQLIKKEALNEAISWGDSYGSTATWPESLIYQAINGDAFLENESYISSDWKNKILFKNWKYEDSSKTDGDAISYYNTMLLWQNEVSAKIGLMYLHDYYFAPQSDGINCWNSYGSSVYSLCANSWIHLSNNDSTPPEIVERLMIRTLTGSDGRHGAFQIYPDGSVYAYNVYFAYSIRPVFYINGTYLIGDGSIDNPYIIS